MRFCPVAELKRMITGLVAKRLTLSRPTSRCIQRVRSAQYKLISQTLFMLSIAINRAGPVCASVIIKHTYMLMCNNKIVINIVLCLLYSTGHIYISRDLCADKTLYFAKFSK